MTEFPPDFVGPADILVCDDYYFDDECPAASLDQLEQDFGIVEALDENGVRIPSIAICPVRFECSRYCGSAPPGPYEIRTCGDANLDGAVTATDALAVLMAAVGSSSCLPEHCDADADGVVASTDALRILVSAVGQGADLQCPPPCAAQTPPGRITTTD
jgi:hypothetical protein